MTLNQIAAGTLNWDVPCNANFADAENRLNANAAGVANSLPLSGGTMSGDLITSGHITAQNAATDPGGTGALMFVKSSAPTTHAATFFQADTTGTTNAAINAVSNNTNFSCFEVTGHELGKGSIKVAHVGPGTNADANAAGLSIDLQGTNTAAQGIFITSTTGSTTGNLINARNNARDDFVVKGTGATGIRVATGHVPSGALEIAQGDDATVGLFMQANSASAQDIIQVRDSGGTNRFRIANNGAIIHAATTFFSTSTQFGSTSGDFGGASGVVISMKDATAAPTTNPTGGGILYSLNGGIPNWRDASGGVYSLTPSSEFTAADHGLVAWTYSPADATNSTLTVSGTVYLAKIVLRTSATINKLYVNVNTVAAGVTANQNFLGLYNSAGTLLAATAAGAIDAGLTATGPLTGTLASSVSATAGTYWISLVNNATTPATLARATGLNSWSNLNLAASAYRFAVNGTSQTSLPATITPASNTQTGAFTMAAAASS